MKNGKLPKKKVSEFLHLSSACMVNIKTSKRIEVWLYDIVGYRDIFKCFEDIRSYTEYLDYRTKRIQDSYQWRKRIDIREKRMKLDYFIRQKKPRPITSEATDMRS